jgi:hypothetical protein
VLIWRVGGINSFFINKGGLIIIHTSTTNSQPLGISGLTRSTSSFSRWTVPIGKPFFLITYFFKVYATGTVLEKRMSHYNLEWEEKNQTILDALQGNNGLEMQQILWNVYDFSGDDKPKKLERKK